MGTILKTPATIFTKIFAGDNFLTSFWIMFNIFHGRKIVHLEQNNKIFAQNFSGTIDIISLTVTITNVLTILLISSYLYAFFPKIPKILWITLLSTLVTFTSLRDKFSGAYIIGAVLLSYFMFACGAITDVSHFFYHASVFLFFPIIIIFFHAIILFGTAKILKIDKDIAIVASQTLIGGPATALAVVNARTWNYQFEAIALGLLGYAIANYFGFGVAKILQTLG